MKRFEDHNPIAVFLYFAGVTVPVMFCRDWLLPLLCAAGVMLYGFSSEGPAAGNKLWLIPAAAALLAVINPIFNHNGMTVVLLVNDMPVTLEAAAYGAATGLMLGAVFAWFRYFSEVMTSDRILYVFGAVSPKLALILSMTLRYIPLYSRQAGIVRRAARASGAGRDETVLDHVRTGLRVFSVLVTWGLENGLVTADSMVARGYGGARRTRYAIYSWRKRDYLLLAAVLILTGAAVTAVAADWVGMDFYPYIAVREMTPLTAAAYTLYAILAALPAAVNLAERVSWHRRIGS
ncbi:MAG: energy-coupling factor transporter transmembrane protein EcfT [Lachnospiraceae bacterium]|nr:energy-coupling factor transporter transmembrane protein EcfT [Lachnospiraceae bacterium]